MGYYILTRDTALRTWHSDLHTYIKRYTALPKRLTNDEFNIALMCDGKTDIKDCKALSDLIKKGIVKKSIADGRTLTSWQKNRSYPGSVKPWLSLEITQKCNYNCMHCFNASDTNRQFNELPYEKICTILDEAAECGIQAVLITGGEPLLHRDFRRIVDAIYSRDLFVHEVNTNGSLLSRDTLQLLASHGNKPEIKISFDGLGYHDRMRGKCGAEKEALKSITLCLEENFPVRIQMNLNRENSSLIRPSLEMLADMGVPRIRIIRTTETPRWNENAPAASYSWEDYYDESLKIAVWYAQNGLSPQLCFWNFMTLYPGSRIFSFERVQYHSGTYRSLCPLCKTIKGMPAIGANGRIYPCLQYSGYLDAVGIILGNVLDDGLLNILSSGRYYDFINTTQSDRIATGDKCASCSWLTWCAGGCPAIGLLESHDRNLLSHDPTACLFFENRWPQKIEDALRGWINGTPLI